MCSGQGHFSLEEEQDFLSCRLSYLPFGEGESSYGRLIGSHQKIPDWLGKILYLGEVETAVRFCIEPWFGNVA